MVEPWLIVLELITNSTDFIYDNQFCDRSLILGPVISKRSVKYNCPKITGSHFIKIQSSDFYFSRQSFNVLTPVAHNL